MIRRPPRSTPLYSSAASDVYKRQVHELSPPNYIHADARIAISCVWPERHEVQVQSFFEAGVGTTYLPQVYAGLSYFFRLLISLLSGKSPHEILSTGNRIFWEITVLPRPSSSPSLSFPPVSHLRSAWTIRSCRSTVSGSFVHGCRQLRVCPYKHSWRAFFSVQRRMG